MEKFFIVTEESPLRKEYLEFKLNQSAVNTFVKNFMPAQGIQTPYYSVSANTLYIVPQKADKEKFETQLCKYSDGQGLRAFKKNSVVGKAWVSELQTAGLKVLWKPFVPFFFASFSGHCRSSILAVDETVYLQFDSEYGVETPAGFVEIKGSEFYKAIEKHNAIKEVLDNV